jgi:predicted amino acid-binding ACT domain protein
VVGPKRGFLIQGDDRVGAVADVVGTLADAKIDVIAIDAVCVDPRYGAFCWVANRDRKKAAQLLGVAKEALKR